MSAKPSQRYAQETQQSRYLYASRPQKLRLRKAFAFYGIACTFLILGIIAIAFFINASIAQNEQSGPISGTKFMDHQVTIPEFSLGDEAQVKAEWYGQDGKELSDILSPQGKIQLGEVLGKAVPVKQEDQANPEDPLAELGTVKSGNISLVVYDQGFDLVNGDFATRYTLDEVDLSKLKDLIKNQADKLMAIRSMKEVLPESIIDLAERRPEARSFVIDYPIIKNKEVSDTVIDNDFEEGIASFKQVDPRWGHAQYCGGTLAENGCGPTAMAIVLRTLSPMDNRFNPVFFRDYAKDNKLYALGVGTTWEFMDRAPEAYGFTSTNIGVSDYEFEKALDAGKMLICSVGPGDFTRNGHFIVIYKQTPEGYRIKDPISWKTTSKTWSYDELAPQIASVWAIGKK